MKKSTITLRSALAELRRKGEAGMTTAEYAVGTIAACAFAALLLTIIKSGAVKELVTSVITSALSVSL